MASVPIDPAKISVRPESLHSHASRVADATDARLHGRVQVFSEAMREGGRHYTAMEEEHARRFAVLVPRGSGAS
jgi:hypothetical protein